MKTKYLFLMMLPLLIFFLQEDELKKPFISYIPAQLNDGGAYFNT